MVTPNRMHRTAVPQTNGKRHRHSHIQVWSVALFGSNFYINIQQIFLLSLSVTFPPPAGLLIYNWHITYKPNVHNVMIWYPNTLSNIYSNISWHILHLTAMLSLLWWVMQNQLLQQLSNTWHRSGNCSHYAVH